MARSKIEWLARPKTWPMSWNPVVGCLPESAGCLNCYAAGMARRFNKELVTVKDERPTFNGQVKCLLDRLDQPLHWQKPRTVFVCSTSDPFHKDVPNLFIRQVLGVIERASKHTFILLTKRAERLPGFEYPDNCWVGVTVENQAAVKRLDSLAAVKAPVRFVSFEPLLGPISLRGRRLPFQWAIIGGESGPMARLCEKQWIGDLMLEVRYVFESPGIFVKQVGRHLAKQMGCKDLKGTDMSAWPESLRIREWPR